jgi:hypothetical protein
VHPTEALYTMLGMGCETVSRTSTAETDVVTGIWKGGRVGTLHGMRGKVTPSKVIVFGTKAVAEQKGSGSYAPLVREIMKFFQTGVAPVAADETLRCSPSWKRPTKANARAANQVQISAVMARRGVNVESGRKFQLARSGSSATCHQRGQMCF